MSYPKDNLKEAIEVHHDQVYEVPQDSHLLTHTLINITTFFRVPTRIVGLVTLTRLDKCMNL